MSSNRNNSEADRGFQMEPGSAARTLERENVV